MAVVDDFGRVTKLSEDLKSLADSLKASVGKAVEYAAERAKDSTDKMKEEFDKLVDAMEELGDGVKDNLESTRKFVDEVKKAAESVERTRSDRSGAGRDSLADAQRDQTRILQQILSAHQKAVSDKAAKFTSGATALASPPRRQRNLKEMGFRPRGADKIPAMVSPGEFVVSKKGVRGNEGVLDKINRGFMRGGKVKPEYLAGGSSGTWEGRKYNIESIDGRAHMVIEGYLDEASVERLRRDFGSMGENMSIEFSDKFDDRLKKSASKWFASMATAFTGGGDPWQMMFEGAVKDVTDFRREMRNLAFQTEGVTGNFRDAQAEFSKIGKDIASRTGVNVTAFQKAYLENSRKGFKDQKAGMKVLESGLELSTMIGSEAQATADLFGDWHRTLGLSAVQMQKMSRDMRTVALNTGVTGKELINAMNSSKEILKNMRNQGTLTSNAAKSVVTMMAEAQKSGYEESTNKVLTALSSHSGMMGADDKTKGLLYSVANRMGGGASQDMLTGNFMRKRENLAGFATNMKDMVANLIGKKGSDLDFSKLEDGERNLLAMRLQGLGIEIGEAENLISTTEKASKGLRGTMDELDKVANSQFSTDEEKALAEKKRNDALLGASMDFLSGIRDKTGNQSLSDAMTQLAGNKEFSDQRQDFAAMAAAVTPAMASQFGLSGGKDQMSKQMAAMDIQKQAQMSSLIAADQLLKAAKAQGRTVKDFGPEMQAALAKGDTKKFNELRDEMQGELSKMGVADATGVDPMERLEQTMSELNETIRKSFSPLIGGVMDLIGVMGLWGIQIGLMGASLHNLFGKNFIKWMAEGNLRSTIMGAFQKGASFMTGPMGGALRNALGPAMLLLGGIKGVMESAEAKRTKTEGFILGALTGGAKTGSFLSPMLGVKSGSATDKALGVAGGMAWGAAAGAAIGTAIVPGAGTIAGAVAGVVIGGVMEILKIITEGTDILQDLFAPIQVVVDYIYNGFRGIYDIVAGIFTLDIGRVIKGVFGLILNEILLIPRLFLATVQAVVIGLPKLILRVFSLIWEIPKAIMGAIKSALAGLVNNPWVGPIFKVLSDAFNAIYDGFMAIWTPISQIFSGLYTVFNDLGKALFGTGKGGGILEGIMWGLQKAVWAVSYVISWLLLPLRLLASALGFVLRIVGNLISALIAPFQYLYDVLVGHSIVPDLVTGIITWFASLPGKIFGFLVKIPVMLGRALLKIPSIIGDMYSKVGSYLQSFGTDNPFSYILTQLGVLYSFIGGTIKNLVGIASGVLSVIQGIFTLDFGVIWDGLSQIGSSIVNQLANVGSFFYKTLRNMGLLLFKTLKRIPMMLVAGMKAVFFEFPKWLVGKLMEGIWAIGNFLFLTLPKMMWEGFKGALRSMGKWLYDTITWPFVKLGELIKSVFWDFPIWLGTKIMEGLKAVFYDLPMWLGGIIMSGLQAIFYDLPVWLGKTIWDGMGQIVAGIPGAIYGALHAAASAIGLGWLVEKLAGGKKGAAGAGAAVGGKGGPNAAVQAGTAGNAVVGATAVVAGAVALKKATPKITKAAVAGSVALKKAAPKITKAAVGTFGNINRVVPKGMKKASVDMAKSVKSSLSPFTKGFSRSMAKGDGLFRSISRGMRGQVASMTKGGSITKFAAKAFQRMGKVVPSSVSKYATGAVKSVKSFFSPFTKGFSRSMAKGDGLFRSISRGMRGQIASMTKGASVSKFASKAFQRMGKMVPSSVSKYATGAMKSVKSFFSPFTKGFSRSMAKGDGLFRSISRGMRGQVASMTKGGSITKFAAKAFQRMGKVVPSSVSRFANSSIKSVKSFFTPMSKGFSRAMASGEGVFKAAARGVKGQIASMVRGGSIRTPGLLSRVGAASRGLYGRAAGFVGNAAGRMGGMGGVVGKVGGLLGKTGGVVGGAVSKAGGVVSGALGKMAPAAGSALNRAGGALGSVAARGAGALAKSIPVLGALLDFGMRKASGQDTKKAAFGAGGGLAGAAAGAAMGTMIAGPIGTVIGGIVGGLGGGWLADKLYDNIGPVFKTVGKGISDASSFVWEGIKGVGSTLWDGAKSLGSKVWEGAKSIGTKFADGAKWLKENVGGAAFGPIGLAFEGIKKVGSWFSSWFGGGEKDNKENKENQIANLTMAKIEAQTVMLSTSVGQHAIPTVRPEEGAPPPSVEPVHLRDITGTILRDRAGSGGNRLQSDELSRMEEASYRQVEELEQIRQGIEELVSLMKPKGGGVAGGSDDMGRGNTKDPRRPMHAAMFGKMKYGKMGGSPNRSLVNNGEC